MYTYRILRIPIHLDIFKVKSVLPLPTLSEKCDNMSRKNKKKRNNNNKAAPEERPSVDPVEVTKGVSQCSLEDRPIRGHVIQNDQSEARAPRNQPEPGPGAAWALQTSEGGEPSVVAARSIRPLEVVIEDTAILTVPVVKVCKKNR